MKSHDVIIQHLQDHMQVEPSTNLRSRILKSATSCGVPRNAVRRRIGMKAAIVAAAFTMLSLTTAFAYGNEIVGAIKEFMFGNSNAAQVEQIDNGNAVIGFKIVNRSELADSSKHDGVIQFTTAAAANQFSQFTIITPSYLPDNVIDLEHIAVQQYIDGTAGYDVYVQYRVEIPNGTSGLNVNQYYAGADAYVELETIHPIQKVMIGDIEASLVYAEGNIEGIRYHLYWMKNDVLYEMICGCYDLKTIISIAESV